MTKAKILTLYDLVLNIYWENRTIINRGVKGTKGREGCNTSFELVK